MNKIWFGESYGVADEGLSEKIPESLFCSTIALRSLADTQNFLVTLVIQKFHRAILSRMKQEDWQALVIDDDPQVSSFVAHVLS